MFNKIETTFLILLSFLVMLVNIPAFIFICLLIFITFYERKNKKKIKKNPTSEMIKSIKEDDFESFSSYFYQRDYMKKDIANSLIQNNRDKMLKLYLTESDNLASFILMEDIDKSSNKIKQILINHDGFALYSKTHLPNIFCDFKQASFKNKVSEF